MLRNALVLCAGAPACVTLDAQRPGGKQPAFEVASIKENVSEPGPPAPDGTAPPPQPSSNGVLVYTAVQEQLGLKLDAQRGPVDMLVIEPVQHPVED